MSISCYFFVEVRAADGKWHLAKRFTDEDFEEFDKEGAAYSFEAETEIDGKKYIVKHEKWTGLQLRDELSWSRAWDRDIAASGLPNDVSDELTALAKLYSEKTAASRRELYANKEYTFDFATQCHYVSLTDLWWLCEKKQEQWKKGLLERIRDTQLDEINDKLDAIKKLILDKDAKVGRKKRKDDECYEDTVEYYLTEYLDEVIQLKTEVSALSEIAENFTGDRWLSADNVRVIFYFD